jgi:integrase/recombinase XerD
VRPVDRPRSKEASEELLSGVKDYWSRCGLKVSSVGEYCRWVHIFREYCLERGLKELRELTLLRVRRFAEYYARHHRMQRSVARESACGALHAWSEGLAACSVNVLTWEPTAQPRHASNPVVRQFIEYRGRHAGLSASTLRQDQHTSLEFLRFMHCRHRTYRTIALRDIDAFVLQLRRRMNVVGIARKLASLRAFLRFLRVTGRLRFDLAESVVGPRLKKDAQPPRALPWTAVQRILRAVDTETHSGRRNYAVLLLMSLYGLGGAEIVGLRLEDINWDRKTICICRPKTQSTILLPLLPQAARALISYLKHSRPPGSFRQVFLSRKLPYVPFAGATFIAYMLTNYARKAGVTNGHLGSHVLRHSQATRQVELGTPLKIVGDILGHRDPKDTSHYTRAAVRRLRDLALPLPHA